MKFPKLVKNAKHVWRFNSARIMSGVVAIQTYWLAAPASWLAVFPQWITSNVAYITLGLVILAQVAQYFHQDLPQPETKP